MFGLQKRDGFKTHRAFIEALDEELHAQDPKLKDRERFRVVARYDASAGQYVAVRVQLRC